MPWYATRSKKNGFFEEKGAGQAQGRCFCEWENEKESGVWGTLCANAGYRGGARFACNLQDAPQGREDRTAPKQAALLASGEIGYEGGLGDVASVAVIGSCS